MVNIEISGDVGTLTAIEYSYEFGAVFFNTQVPVYVTKDFPVLDLCDVVQVNGMKYLVINTDLTPDGKYKVFLAKKEKVKFL